MLFLFILDNNKNKDGAELGIRFPIEVAAKEDKNMSVLRRVKLRTPDGIESIEYPLGVEAKNVEVANQENLSQRLVRIDEDLEKNEEDIAAVSELAGTNKQNIGAAEIRIDALERKSASVDKKPYYFDTVADMKAYQGLKEGDMAITLGYYTANDGGNGEYRIVSGTHTDDGGSYHKLENNLFAELVINNGEINVKQFGAYGDGSHDDTNIIQNVINFSQNNKRVIIPNGIFVITNLTIPSKTYISGKSYKSTILKVKNGTTGNIISMTDDVYGGNHTTIANLQLNGENITCNTDSGIYIDIRQNDAWIKLEDLVIKNITGDGINIAGGRECRFNNLQISRCTGWGFNSGGSDNEYLFITASGNQLGGIYSHSAASRYISCKCFANGVTNQNGFYVTSAIGQTFVACEAQENFGHGFLLDQCKNSNFIALRADCNGLVDRKAYTVTSDESPIAGKDYYTYDQNTNTYHCLTRWSDLESFTPNVIYYEKPLHYSGICLVGWCQSCKIDGVCDDFRRVEDADPCQLAGIVLGQSITSCDINIRTADLKQDCIIENETKLVRNNFNIMINGKMITKFYNKGVVVNYNPDKNNTAISLMPYNTQSVMWDILNYRDGAFRIDRIDNGAWQSNPFKIDIEDNIHMGTASGKIGFFGTNGDVKQTVSNAATDLNSVIALANNLRTILIKYGLIS